MKFNLTNLILIVLVSFSAGIMTGNWLNRPGFHKPWKHKEPEKRMLELYSSKLNLTADQKTKVEKILSEAKPKMRALHNETRPKFEAIRVSVNAQIRTILNDDQKIKFDKLEAQWEARMKKFGPPEHP